ncbi:phosphoserine phosphatase serb [Rhizophagus irregularis]|uniref:phosphoserine phosphatase n=3 Tax=Rhizophagus irregularis TaxID=588596 RepID=U9UDP3_RHIID|nr:HAD-like domain-containing protein [Rhizophagus irregularis DAOM 181602=DAOM 197198]EXX71092.1 phosphoserine phosphatase [Rhizophagus irregularis DAOM 197198w]PKC04106.1 phosphoserine phosphatase serb [Rhizophagus irregularis]PKC74508.1 phosphoserine phosphatase serb [Rhizophagus irregularis]PKY18194.1 phosphoserine phosphatase serb [Rhizophagus irregularis]POG67625.1 HAD-like domain-containing protein [Rhizophagus irregularis DAOM 181602=DAOM 197198]|eukprot:XP_025174491.1 HAD-like domain-containing protein [Rhizophagus irregularis DAOM 181602=DAOM 197198]
MKFGKYLRERKEKFPVEWREHSIDYDSLKSYIKTNIIPNSLKLNLSQMTWKPTNSNELHFIELVSSRLSALQIKVTEFLVKLDNEIQKVSDFFVKESNSLIKKSEEQNVDTLDENEASKMLESIIILERFVFLNYTGLVKILKKNDKHSGLNIGEAYLYRIASLTLTKSDSLLILKKSLMKKVVQEFSPIASTTSTIINNETKLENNSTTISSSKSSSSSLGMTTLPALLSKIPQSTTSPTTTKKNLFPPLDLLPHQKVIASITGPHGTDIIGCVLECMAKHDCVIEDFMLSRLYHDVTFGVLIALRSDDIDLFKDLAEASRKWDGTLTFDVHDGDRILPIEDAPYENRIKYAATVLNQKGLSPQFLNDWTKFLLKGKISVEKMQRLNEGKLSCADYKLSVPNNTDFERLRQELFTLSTSHGTDVALQPYDVFREHKRLVVFDMDSTLIQQEVIDEIARHAGVVKEVASITELAMNGEIDFKESLRRRVSLLKGTPVEVLQTIKENLTFTDGAHFLCKALKKIGFKLAVISGGFIPLAKYVKNELGLDYAFANQLKVSSDGLTLTGETVGPIVDAERKAELLEVIAQAENVTLDQVIAVGDGANDLLMLAKAGLGIAFNAKPRVQEKARARINQKSLKYVLYLLGYTDEDAKQLYDS